MLIECRLESWTETSNEIVLVGRFSPAARLPENAETSLLVGEKNKLIGIVFDSPTGERFVAMRGSHEEVTTQVPHSARASIHDGELRVAIPKTGVAAVLQK